MTRAILCAAAAAARAADLRRRIVGERSQWRGFPRTFWFFMLANALFTLGNSSDAFLLLRAMDLGLESVSIPILWFVFHLSTVRLKIE